MVNNRGLKKDLATSLAVVYLSLRENQNEFFNKMIEKVHWIFNLIISIPAKKKKKKKFFRKKNPSLFFPSKKKKKKKKEGEVDILCWNYNKLKHK